MDTQKNHSKLGIVLFTIHGFVVVSFWLFAGLLSAVVDPNNGSDIVLLKLYTILFFLMSVLGIILVAVNIIVIVARWSQPKDRLLRVNFFYFILCVLVFLSPCLASFFYPDNTLFTGYSLTGYF